MRSQYIVSMAPRTPPRSVSRSNSSITASSTRSVSSSMMKEPWSGFSFFARPSSRLMISWMAMARRTLDSVGVVMASSKALVCSELQLS